MVYVRSKTKTPMDEVNIAVCLKRAQQTLVQHERMKRISKFNKLESDRNNGNKIANGILVAVTGSNTLRDLLTQLKVLLHANHYDATKHG